MKYMQAPTVIFRLPISPIEKMVLFVMANTQRQTRAHKIEIEQSLIASIIGSDRTYVSKIINKLEENDYVGIEYGKSRKKQECNSYTINWEKIKEFTTENDWYEDMYVEQPVTPIVEEVKQEEEVIEEQEDYSLEEEIYDKIPYIMIPYYSKDAEEYYKRMLEVINEVLFKHPNEERKDIMTMVDDMIEVYKSKNVA